MSDGKRFTVAHHGRFLLEGWTCGPLIYITQNGRQLSLNRGEARKLAVELELWARREVCPTCGHEKEPQS